MVKKGTWVCITKTLLTEAERAAGIPEDTAKTPLRMWVNGFLQEDAEIGSDAVILTKMNRRETGILESVQPTTRVDYGDFVPEVLPIGAQAREMLFGGAG